MHQIYFIAITSYNVLCLNYFAINCDKTSHLATIIIKVINAEHVDRVPIGETLFQLHI